MKLIWERGEADEAFQFCRIGAVTLGAVRLTDDQERCWAKCSLPGIRPADAMFDSGAGARRFVEDAVRLWFSAAGHPLPDPAAPTATELHDAPEDRDYRRAGAAR